MRDVVQEKHGIEERDSARAEAKRNDSMLNWAINEGIGHMELAESNRMHLEKARTELERAQAEAAAKRAAWEELFNAVGKEAAE